ncbi:branched-chain amino acid ABC transporter permease [Niveibacterium sp. 24ML]|uniref:branched-chain amino acid ABC transporter permease n=1 Tax=Niveibacterium sp. 24ML TaxID=2985512 RepID=UPI002271E587|nr:branched-chain amino acid ABC transporter permease [Niveibacterium sp. 24ML]MCX9157332.1 branched-chain amino acid ABC transporter permease [Niveibacterium sp. 24ML]
MQTLLQQIVNGLVVGSVYAVVALGYTMVYGILGLINFAHGEVLMVGALVALSAITFFQSVLPDLHPIAYFVMGLLVAMPVCMAVGYTIERTAYRRLRNAPRLAPLITAIGVSFLLQTLAMIIWGRNYHSFPQLIQTAPIEIVAGVFMTPVQMTTVGVSAAMMIGLVILVTRTNMGRAMRATAENHRVASLMGVDTNRIIALTFIIGSALAAVAGVMIASNYGVAHYSMGFLPGLKAFTAAVLGGIGNLAGAMVGGIVLGLVEAIGAGYIETWTGGWLNSSYQDIFAFLILGIVLIFRPTGLLGERVADRA